MKLRLLTVFSIVLSSASASYAASTLQISAPVSGAIASNFANAAGVATNGMIWGIVVDTAGDGFAASGGSAYAAMTSAATLAQFMNDAGGATNDYFVPSANLTSDSSAAPEAGFTVFGSNGTITNIAVNYANGISQNDPFALIWFNTNSGADGDRYGFLNIGQLMPADNLPAVDMSAPFAGVDPLRSATNVFGVPEPSRAVLAGLGLLGMLFRRRR